MSAIHDRIIEVDLSNGPVGWRGVSEVIASVFPEARQHLRDYLELYVQSTGEEAFWRRFAVISAQVPPDLSEEIAVLSEALGLSARELCAINLIGDICQPTGCSTAGFVRGDGSPVLGHNLDWPDLGLAHHLSCIQLLRSPGMVLALPGFVGMCGCAMGMSARGVAVLLHDSYTQAPYDPVGCVPLGLTLRTVLARAKSAREVVLDLAELRPTHGCMVYAADPTGAYLLEHARTHVSLRRIQDVEPVCRCNHFLDLRLPNGYEESERRQQHLVRAAAAVDPSTASLEQCLGIVRSPGVFRELTPQNLRAIEGSSLHSVACSPAERRLLATFVTSFPERYPTAEVTIEVA